MSPPKPMNTGKSDLALLLYVEALALPRTWEAGSFLRRRRTLWVV